MIVVVIMIVLVGLGFGLGNHLLQLALQAFAMNGDAAVFRS